jgi:hypothetical protein
MADIFYEPGTAQGPDIQYANLAEKLFPLDNKQKLTPFLGAGASLPRRALSPPPTLALPLQAKIDAISDELGLKEKSRARLFMELAVRLASVMHTKEGSAPEATPDAQAVFKQVMDSRFPPGADDLAEVLACLSSYDTFERPRQKLRALLTANDSDLVQVLRWIALLTDITRPTAPLISVSSYYEYTNQRDDLWQKLHRLFANKKRPTATNFLVARAAHWHLRQTRAALRDYLIITTNYDCLMEVALDLFKVPYCVLTVDRNDRKVYGRVSADLQKYLGYSDEDYSELQHDLNGRYFPTNFSLEKNRPVAVVYKIHGCLFRSAKRDSIIVSDEDYIDYLCRISDHEGMVPGAVSKLMQGKGFLFAGYSFSDWNVRGIYKTLLEKRAGRATLMNATIASGEAEPAVKVQDYAVVRDLNLYESAFFKQKNISLLKTELDRFSWRIRTEARKWIKNSAVDTPS